MVTFINIYTLTGLFVVFISVMAVTFYFVKKYEKKAKPLEKQIEILRNAVDNSDRLIAIFDKQHTYFINERFKLFLLEEGKDPKGISLISYLDEISVSGVLKERFEQKDVNEDDEVYISLKFTGMKKTYEAKIVFIEKHGTKTAYML